MQTLFRPPQIRKQYPERLRRDARLVYLCASCFLLSRSQQWQEKFDQERLARDTSADPFDSALRSAGWHFIAIESVDGRSGQPFAGS
jgi:hypothetical protein